MLLCSLVKCSPWRYSAGTSQWRFEDDVWRRDDEDRSSGPMLLASECQAWIALVFLLLDKLELR